MVQLWDRKSKYRRELKFQIEKGNKSPKRKEKQNSKQKKNIKVRIEYGKCICDHDVKSLPENIGILFCHNYAFKLKSVILN